MREAIGSSWLVYIAVIFIMIYIFFIGFVMNYASAYRAANYVITEIENCNGEITNCDKYAPKDMMEEITKVIKHNYKYFPPNYSGYTATNTIYPSCRKSGNGIVYSITLPVQFELPLLGGIRWMVVQVETKTIPKIECPS